MSGEMQSSAERSVQPEPTVINPGLLEVPGDLTPTKKGAAAASFTDLLSVLGAESPFAREVELPVPPLSLVGRAAYGLVKALSRFCSDEIALKFARISGCGEYQKAELVADLIRKGGVSNLYKTLRTIGLEEEYLFKYLRTTDPLRNFSSLKRVVDVSEQAQFGLLMSALERRDPGIANHCSSLPFERDRTLNEEFVARLITIYPEIALRNKDTFKGLVVFDETALVEKLVREEPFVFLENDELCDLLSGEQRRDTMTLAATSDPTRLVTAYERSQHRPVLPLEDREALAAFLIGTALPQAKCDMSALAVCKAFEVENQDVKQAAYSFDIERDPSTTLRALQEYQLGGEALEGALNAFASKGLAKEVLSSLSTFDGVPREHRVSLVRALEQHDVEALYQKISQVLDWVGPFQIEKIELPLMLPYWKRLLMHRSELGIESQPVVRQLILRKLESHAHLVKESLHELNLGSFVGREEIAVALCTKLPEDTPYFIEALGITEPTCRAALEYIFAREAPDAAQRWMAQGGSAPSPAFVRALLLGKMKMRSDPWSVLERVLQISEEERGDLSEVFALCALDNASRTIRECASWGLRSQSLRLLLFDICAQTKLWQALEAAEEMGVVGTRNLERAFATAMVRDSGRAIALLPSLKGFTPEELRGLFRQAIRSNAAASMRILGELPFAPAERVEFVRQAVRRNARIFGESAELIDDLLPEDSLPSVLAAHCRGDVKRAIEFELPTDWPQMSKKRIAKACALESYDRAIKSAPSKYRGVITEPDVLEHLIVNAVAVGRWNSALAVAKQMCSQDTTEPHEAVQGLGPALERLDSVLNSLADFQSLDAAEQANILLMKRIRNANCMPTDAIQKTLDYFGEDDADFLLSIAERGGSSIAENIFESLLEQYKDTTDITALDRDIIDAALSLGFRGLSPNLFVRVRPIFERSPIQGRNALRNYSRVASMIVNGQKVDAALIEPELFPSLVVAAYRPVGMTEATVRGLLSTVPDHSEHLSSFVFPATGYSMNLQGTTAVTLKSGQSLDEQVLARTRQILEGTLHPERPLIVPVLLKRLLQGAFDQIDLAEVWGTLRQKSQDLRVEEMSSKSLLDLAPEKGMRSKARALNATAELFSVVAYDAILDLARTNLESTQPNEALRLNPKLEGMIKRILRLSPDVAITQTETLAAIEVQVGKLFRNHHSALMRETRKFTQAIQEASDRYVMYVSKSQAAFFGRAGAGLCTHSEMWSWNNPDFLQMIMVDKLKGQIVGNVQLHLFTNRRGERSLLARINPTSVFLNVVDKETLASEMMTAVDQFATGNQLKLYLPEQTAWHQLTNRDPFEPSLSRYFGRPEECSVQITATRTVTRAYRVDMSPAAGRAREH